jgi:hypothetical protein
MAPFAPVTDAFFFALGAVWSAWLGALRRSMNGAMLQSTSFNVWFAGPRLIVGGGRWQAQGFASR